MHPDTHERHETLPTGFIRRRPGKACPFTDKTNVELMIRTPDGTLGSTGITRPSRHDWTIPTNEAGGVVGYRRTVEFPSKG
jgi:hypothetical protein